MWCSSWARDLLCFFILLAQDLHIHQFRISCLSSLYRNNINRCPTLWVKISAESFRFSQSKYSSKHFLCLSHWHRKKMACWCPLYSFHYVIPSSAGCGKYSHLSADIYHYLSWHLVRAYPSFLHLTPNLFVWQLQRHPDDLTNRLS